MNTKYLITSKYIMLTKNFKTGEKYIRNILMNQNYILTNIDLELLQECENQKELKYLIDKYGEDKINEYLNMQFLFYNEELWKQYNLSSAEIEIGTQCNYKCLYCPVSVDEKIKKVMPLDFFELIIKKIVDHETIHNVTFNSYNEPLMDIFFSERLDILSKTRLKLNLHTNASLLTNEKIELIKKYINNINFVCINIPSIDEDEYVRMTNTNKNIFKKAINNIDNAIDSGLPIRFSVNGTKKELAINLKKIQEKYSDKLTEKISHWMTTDRAGFLINDYSKKINLKGKLYGGCNLVLNWISISVDGDCFICCEDYMHNFVYGNIKYNSIKDIMESEKAILLRKYVYGELEPDNNFICRKCINMNYYRINGKNKVSI